MAEDPRDALVTARIYFEGIMLICINADEHCEVGFIPCSRHKARMTVEIRGPGITPRFNKYYDITHDLYIQVVNPQTQGVVLQKDGLRNLRCLPDLEGSRLHDSQVDVRIADLASRLAINAGTLYAHDLSVDSYELMKWDEIDRPGTRERTWGQLVDDLCLNVVCQNASGSEIRILNATDDSPNDRLIETLPRLPDPSFYEIHIENDCEGTSFGREASDFRFYYDVITAQDNLQYDLVKPPGAPSPHICESALLSRTDSLGLTFRP